MLAAANWAFAPTDIGWLTLHPHPLFLVVVLTGLRYGVTPGMTVGALSALAHLGAQALPPLWQTLGPSDLDMVLDLLNPAQPILLLFVGVGVGGLRQHHLRAHAQALAKVKELGNERGALETRLSVAEQARTELERRVVEPEANIALLYLAAQRLETLEEEELYSAITQIVADHIYAQSVHLYVVDGAALTLRSYHGDELPASLPDRNKGLVSHALNHKHAVSIRDQLRNNPNHTDFESEPLLAVALHNSSDEPMAVITIRDMPFIHLTAATQRLLTVLAAWAAKSVEKARMVRALREQTVYDDLLGVLRFSYFQRRLKEECQRVRRYRYPVAIFLVRILHWHNIDEKTQLALRRTISFVLSRMLRHVDQIYQFSDEATLATLLPHTPIGGSIIAKSRIVRSIRQLGLTPYGDDTPIDFALGVSMITHEIENAEAVISAAEADCKPISTEVDTIATASSEVGVMTTRGGIETEPIATSRWEDAAPLPTPAPEPEQEEPDPLEPRNAQEVPEASEKGKTAEPPCADLEERL